MIQTFLVIDSITKNVLSVCFTKEKAEEVRLNYIIQDLKNIYKQLQTIPKSKEALQLIVYLLDNQNKITTLPFKFNEYHSLNRYYIYTFNPGTNLEIPNYLCV